ncbi:diguanylate cyclase [Gammaproteobacteria bacterium]
MYTTTNINMKPPHVLIADDDPTVRLLMQAALERHDFAVTVVEDGESALDVFSPEVDMILLDVEMPGISGFDVCKTIRRSAGMEIPVVMVTGHDDVASIEQAYELGATDFIVKPINWTLFGHRARYILRAFRTLQLLNSAEAKHRALLTALPDLLIHVNSAGDILEWHGTGVAGIELGDHPNLTRIFAPNTAAYCMESIEHAIATGQLESIVYDCADQNHRAHYYEGRIVAMRANEALFLIRDVSERHEAEQKIHRLAYFDALTGLPNRQFFHEQLERELAHARRENERLAVLFLDLDGFKGINDSLGHSAGDQVLQRVSECLRAGLRPFDVLGRQSVNESFENAPVIVENENGSLNLARLGGDEFTIVLPSIQQAEDAFVVAHRIREMIGHPFVIDGQELVVTASIGIGIFPDDAQDSCSLLKYADTAMYAAKSQGRDNCQYYSASLTEQAVARLSMDYALRMALERNEFYLLYQPQLDVQTNTIQSVEALIRWQHPERGTILPMEFIPLANDLGLILPISIWVLRTACTDAMRWQALGLPPVQMLVNLIPARLINETLYESILEILRDTGLPPERLEIEITESSLMTDGPYTLGLVRKLREYRVKVTLDDFGAGCSSLKYLKELPFDKINIDRIFVRDMLDSKESTAIVNSIIELAKVLEMRVVAEGVETMVQHQALLDIGCDIIQGHLLSPAVSFEDAVTLLKRSSQGLVS